MPPTSVISTTSPEVENETSVSDAFWTTSALVAPARPAITADRTKAASLYCRARYPSETARVSEDAVENLAKRRMDRRRHDREANHKHPAHKTIENPRIAEINEAERFP